MKDLLGDFLTALEADVLRPAFFFEGRFTALAGGDPIYVRAWTGDRDITFKGETFEGNGWFLGSSSVEDSDAVDVSKSLTISLSAASEELRAVLLNTRANEPGTLWFALLDEDGAVIDSAIEFAGFFETANFDKQSDSFTVSLRYETRTRNLSKSKERRWTDEQQRLDYPDDLGFQYMQDVAQWSGVWQIPDIPARPLR